MTDYMTVARRLALQEARAWRGYAVAGRPMADHIRIDGKVVHAADPLNFIIGINRIADRRIGLTFWLGQRRYLSVGRYLR